MRMLRWYDSREERPAFSRRKKNMPYFNPRSRMENDHKAVHVFLCTKISIHVPAWGTTEQIPAHSHMGDISIHVPAWGTTPRGCCVNIAVEFQSTFPRGERLSINCCRLCVSSFQSTFPRGERRAVHDLCGVGSNFNPRSRVGNDELKSGYDDFTNISIHVPAWGTTH